MISKYFIYFFTLYIVMYSYLTVIVNEKINHRNIDKRKLKEEISKLKENGAGERDIFNYYKEHKYNPALIFLSRIFLSAIYIITLIIISTYISDKSIIYRYINFNENTHNNIFLLCILLFTINYFYIIRYIYSYVVCKKYTNVLSNLFVLFITNLLTLYSSTYIRSLYSYAIIVISIASPLIKLTYNSIHKGKS